MVVRRWRALVALGAAVVSGLTSGVAAPPAVAGVDGEILYLRSTDGGVTWTGPANLSADADESEQPHVAADAGGVHVVWKEGDEGEVAYRRSADGGATFALEANLSRTPGDSAESDVAVAGAGVHVVWAEEIDGEDDVYLVSSADGGTTFGEHHNVSDGPTQKSKDPDLVVAGTVLAVVYEHEVSSDKEDIFFRASGDSGETWVEIVNVSNDADKSTEPAVARDGDTIHVVWEARGDDLQPADDRVAYSRSTGAGATFTARVLLPSETALGEPAVASVGGVVHVASCSPLDETGAGASELWYHRSPDAGATWAPPVNLSSNPGECDTPAITISGSTVHIAWADSSPGLADIHLRRSRDGGMTFDAIQNVSATPGDSEDPSIGVDPTTGVVHLTWTDSSGQTPAPPPTPASAGILPDRPHAATARPTRRRP